MNETGWFVKTVALTGSYVKEDMNFKAKHMKIKTDNTVTFSFNGNDDHGTVVAADGMVDFQDLNKGEIHLKGTGNVTVMAWDGE